MEDLEKRIAALEEKNQLLEIAKQQNELLILCQKLNNYVVNIYEKIDFPREEAPEKI